MNHGWQSESTDGPTGGWSCVFFWNGCKGSGHLATTAGCSVVQCSCSQVVVVVAAAAAAPACSVV